MACTKCSEKFELKNSGGTIYFISEIDELVRKSEIFLKEHSLENKNFSGLLTIDTNNVFKFLSLIC